MHREHLWDSQILQLCSRPLTSGEGVSIACRELMMHGGLTLQNSRRGGEGSEERVKESCIQLFTFRSLFHLLSASVMKALSTTQPDEIITLAKPVCI